MLKSKQHAPTFDPLNTFTQVASSTGVGKHSEVGTGAIIQSDIGELQACSIVLTRGGSTLLYVLFAVAPCVGLLAIACVVLQKNTPLAVYWGHHKFQTDITCMSKRPARETNEQVYFVELPTNCVKQDTSSTQRCQPWQANGQEFRTQTWVFPNS